MEFRIGHGYDVHTLQDGLPMWLGGIRIEYARGFVAHSDGDVAIHALCDAILGAAGLGDIGLHVPDSDPAVKGIDSKRLLAETIRKISAEGWKVANADITIALQAPKLRPHIDAMKAVLSPILGTDALNIKATTTERLGFVGRGEGCEVWAVALLER